MKTLNKYVDEQMKNEDFKAAYDDQKQEIEIIRAVIDARNSMHLTQKELAAATGIAQADISKIENGTRNPSLKMLKRLAEGMGMELELIEQEAHVVHWKAFETILVISLLVSFDVLWQFNLVGIYQRDGPKSPISGFYLGFLRK